MYVAMQLEYNYFFQKPTNPEIKKEIHLYLYLENGQLNLAHKIGPDIQNFQHSAGKFSL